MLDLFQFVSAMRTALYQCGRVAQTLQGKVAGEEKEPDSIHQTSTSVSAVDRLCQEILLLGAHRVAPYLQVQSEEMEDCPPAIRDLFSANQGRYVLILDPVDGTGDYLADKPTYAHMLGVLDRKTARMVCGLIHFPERDRFYLGLRGTGAFVADGLTRGFRPLQPRVPPKTVEDVKRLREKDYQVFQQEGFQLVQPESGSAAHELTRVAQGRLGVMVMRHFHGHDTAISSVIIEELGGIVLQENQQTVRYEKEMPRMSLVISSLNASYARSLSAALSRDSE